MASKILLNFDHLLLKFLNLSFSVDIVFLNFRHSVLGGSKISYEFLLFFTEGGNGGSDLTPNAVIDGEFEALHIVEESTRERAVIV